MARRLIRTARAIGNPLVLLACVAFLGTSWYVLTRTNIVGTDITWGPYGYEFFPAWSGVVERTSDRRDSTVFLFVETEPGKRVLVAERADSIDSAAPGGSHGFEATGTSRPAVDS
ncbi:MAG TPA: hypothetical protein VD971_04430 [Phycisphaerales bacterium]|nr:hypothetical protein [Phycisphaerales bacterium]